MVLNGYFCKNLENNICYQFQIYLFNLVKEFCLMK